MLYSQFPGGLAFPQNRPGPGQKHSADGKMAAILHMRGHQREIMTRREKMLGNFMADHQVGSAAKRKRFGRKKRIPSADIVTTCLQ